MTALTSTRTPAIAGVAALLLVLGSASVAVADAVAFSAGTPRIAIVAADEASAAGESVALGPDLEGLTPGESVSCHIVVRNSGSAAAKLDLTAPVIENAAGGSGEKLQNAMTLTIVDAERDLVLYSGPLTEAGFSDLMIDHQDPDGVPLTITTTLDDDASEAVCGQRIGIVLNFSAYET